MTTEIQKKQVHPVVAFKNYLNSPLVLQEVTKRLGKNSGDFTNSVIELISGSTTLQQCDPAKILQCALKAASLHLPLNPQLGKSYVITFNNTIKKPDGTVKKEVVPTFIIGYKGLVQLAKNSGQIKILNTGVIYEGMLDENGFDYLSGEIKITGKPTSRKVEGFFAHMVELNGFTKTLYMTAAEMAHYAKIYSPSLKFNTKITEDTLLQKFNLHSEKGAEIGVGWLADSITMAKKVVLKQLLDKWGNLSIDIQKAIADDEQYEMNPEADRNSAAAADKPVWTDATEVKEEEVDKETGEVITPKKVFPGDDTES